jgi:hypothetical protein
LSKRVVFVMVDGGTDPNGWDGGLDLGVKAFVQDYMRGRLEKTAGAVRGAILLDVAPGACFVVALCLPRCAHSFLSSFLFLAPSFFLFS